MNIDAISLAFNQLPAGMQWATVTVVLGLMTIGWRWSIKSKARTLAAQEDNPVQHNTGKFVVPVLICLALITGACFTLISN
jgi:hypothetical protein